MLRHAPYLVYVAENVGHILESEIRLGASGGQSCLLACLLACLLFWVFYSASWGLVNYNWLRTWLFYVGSPQQFFDVHARGSE